MRRMGHKSPQLQRRTRFEFLVEEGRGTPRQNIQNKICVTRPPYLPPSLAHGSNRPKLPRISSQKGFLPTNTTCHPWRPTSHAPFQVSAPSLHGRSDPPLSSATAPSPRKHSCDNKNTHCHTPSPAQLVSGLSPPKPWAPSLPGHIP